MSPIGTKLPNWDVRCRWRGRRRRGDGAAVNRLMQAVLDHRSYPGSDAERGGIVSANSVWHDNEPEDAQQLINGAVQAHRHAGVLSFFFCQSLGTFAIQEFN